MATDVNVQYFSHLNGLMLGNNWGDMIRLLDTCLVNGLALSEVISASINDQGDITLDLFTDHKSLLFQIIELSGFEPVELNGKYRIKGVPTSKQLVLKATHVGKSVTKKGVAKLSALGYDIIFRDTNDVKRVYRAKNPRVEHPFIRVDESLTSPDGITGVYNSSYAKYAMVGLLENMTHIDDFADSSKLQLPFSSSSVGLNWSISGTGTSVSRGWSRWYYANRGIGLSGSDSISPNTGLRAFTLCGDKDAFYLLNPYDTTNRDKKINGCGLFLDASEETSNVIPNWFLMTHIPNSRQASTSVQLFNESGGSTLTYQQEQSCFYTTTFNLTNRLTNHSKAYPVVPDYKTGNSDLQLQPIYYACMQIPFYDVSKRLRGTLKHVHYNAFTGSFSITASSPMLSSKSMFVLDSCYNPNSLYTSVNFYLGEIE